MYANPSMGKATTVKALTNFPIHKINQSIPCIIINIIIIHSNFKKRPFIYRISVCVNLSMFELSNRFQTFTDYSFSHLVPCRKRGNYIIKTQIMEI